MIFTSPAQKWSPHMDIDPEDTIRYTSGMFIVGGTG